MSRMRREQRRDFLKHFCATLAGGSALSLIPQLRLMQSALAAPLGDPNYRALVCVFLNGGSDSFNRLVPTDARHATYLASRGGVYAGTNGPLGLGLELPDAGQPCRARWRRATECRDLRPGTRPAPTGLRSTTTARSIADGGDPGVPDAVLPCGGNR